MMVSFTKHEREHKIEALHERNARLAALREVREMCSKYGEDDYISVLWLRGEINALIAKEEGK